MAVDLAKYVVSLEAQTAQYVQKLDQANKKLDRFHKDQERAVAKIKTAFLSLGATLASALSVRAIANFTRASVQMGDELGETARAAGVSAEKLQQLRFAFDQLGGIAGGETDQGLQRFNRTLGLAINGSRQAQQQFRLLGVAFKDSLGNGRGTDETLEAVLRSLGEIENDAQRAAIAGRLFGQELGPKLAAALKGGSQALDQAREQVVGIISDESVRKAEALDDAFKRMAATIGGPLKQAAINAAFEISRIFGYVEDDPQDVLNDKIAETELRIKSLQDSIARNKAVARHGGVLGAILGDDTLDADLARLSAGLVQAQMDLAVFQAAAATTGDVATAQFIEPMETGLKRIGDLIDRLELKRPNIELDLLPEDGLQEIGVGAKPISLDDLIKPFPAAEVDRLFKPISDKGKETAIFVGQQFESAFADWILGTERSFGDLLKRMAAQMATSALFKGLATFFGDGTFFSSFFGGARAEGGPVSGGKSYLVGERGPELFVPGMSGAIVPGGGGMSVSITNSIDARGADPSLISRLPAILEANNRKVKAEIQDLQRRARF